MKNIRLSLSILCMVSCACACLSTSPEVEVSLANLSTSDIEGIWRAEYDFSDGVEILTLNSEDNTYSQVYEDINAFLYSGTGTWEIYSDSNGRVFVRLNNALWFPLGAKQALLKGMDPNPYLQGESHHFYDHQTNTFILMPDMLVLEVIPRDNSKGFDLFHFAWHIDDAPEHFDPVIK